MKDDKDFGPDKESAMISGKLKRKNHQYTLSTQPPFNRFTGNQLRPSTNVENKHRNTMNRIDSLDQLNKPSSIKSKSGQRTYNLMNKTSSQRKLDPI